MIEKESGNNKKTFSKERDGPTFQNVSRYRLPSSMPSSRQIQNLQKRDTGNTSSHFYPGDQRKLIETSVQGGDDCDRSWPGARRVIGDTAPLLVVGGHSASYVTPILGSGPCTRETFKQRSNRLILAINLQNNFI